jgi:phosphatidylserine/phosphatidylglycerophosphate/cardiolipin synthase-like enzyme
MDPLLANLTPIADRLARLDDPAGGLECLRAAIDANDREALLKAVGGDRLARLALERAGAIDGHGEVAAEAFIVLARLEIVLAIRACPVDAWRPVFTVPAFLRQRIAAGTVAETMPFWYSTLERARRRAVLTVPYLDDGFQTLIPGLGRLGRRGGSVLLLTRGLRVNPSERNRAVIASLRMEMPPGTIEVLSWDDGGLGLHAKALVVDSEIAYVGSANFTWAGMNAQAELGVELSGPSVAALEALLEQLADELRIRKSPHAK